MEPTTRILPLAWACTMPDAIGPARVARGRPSVVIRVTIDMALVPQATTLTQSNIVEVGVGYVARRRAGRDVSTAGTTRTRPSSARPRQIYLHKVVLH